MPDKQSKIESPAAVSSAPLVSGDRLIQLLVKHGIVDPCAYEDPDGYDNWRTVGACKAVAKELSELIANESSSPTAGGGKGGAQKGQTK